MGAPGKAYISPPPPLPRTRALAAAVECADGHNIERVAHALQVILLQLRVQGG